MSLTIPDKTRLTQMATAIRVLSMDAVHRARSGHQGMPLGMADVATVLWSHFLKYDPTCPDWSDRDRFVLSAGHGSMLLYALLYLSGFKSVSLDDIKAFRQWNASTPGHPEYGHTEGVECTTGPLGQGLATAVGMAIAERHLNARFGDDLVNHKTWVISGDGCLMEGVSHEAISLAGRLKLKNLIVLFDDNNITIDGFATLAETGDQLARFQAAGWCVKRIDGHDYDQIFQAMRWAQSQDRPVLIACKTLIARGAGPKEGDKKGHGYNLMDPEIQVAKAHLGWPEASFEIPTEVTTHWREAGSRGAHIRTQWEMAARKNPLWSAFSLAVSGTIPNEACRNLDLHIDRLLTSRPAQATRVSSGSALSVLVPDIDALIGGSADLTGSVNTWVAGMGVLDIGNYEGRYIHYGVREFGMAAAMNGLALHGGLIPYAGTFFVFSDYSRAAIRLSALMKLKVIHVMTHDSIGVGEDGPTHQPVEHLAAFRAMPGLRVMRPADAVETAECWKAALTADGPTLLVLSRQSVPAVRGGPDRDLAQRGAYELKPASAPAEVSLFATGSEVSIALAARDRLEACGVPTRVVSVPSFELFRAQSLGYRREVIGKAPLRVAIEAGVRFGWDGLIGEDGEFVGMEGFGASAPAEVLFEAFGISQEHVVNRVLTRRQSVT